MKKQLGDSKMKVFRSIVNKRPFHKSTRLAFAVLFSLGIGIQTGWTAFPTHYDLRDEARVTQIRNQRDYGTCWAFGAMASLESNYITQLQKAGVAYNREDVDFSERNLAWLAYAAPVDAPDYPLVHLTINEKVKGFDVKHYEGRVYNQGGGVEHSLNVLARGDGLIWEKYAPYEYTLEQPMEGVEKPDAEAVAGLLKNAYLLPSGDMIPPESTQEEIDNYITNYKALIQENGAIVVGYKAADSSIKDIYTPAGDTADHEVSLIGWDDTYRLRDKNGNLLYDENGELLKPGAWILRNSWGEQVGDHGYYYISYYDQSLNDGASYVMETDAKRYTRIDQHDLLVASRGLFMTVPGQQASFAGQYTANAPQFVKAVSFFTSEDNVKYKIEILSDAKNPEDGKTVYTEEGQFTGNERFSGYHTVDLDHYVFIPQGGEYVARITLIQPDGTKETKIFLNCQEEPMGNLDIQPGQSFVFNEGGWMDLYDYVDPESSEQTPAGVYMRSLAKDTDQANGGDFTVKYLHNGGLADGSRINLGKKDELYGSDPLQPDHRTLSNLTVDLTYGLTDSAYGGEIFGEGSVTKTGTGLFNLTGSNTYTGGSYVNQGVLQIDGSVASDVWAQQSGMVSGKGRIGGSLVNHAAVQPGSYGGTETLTVDGDFISDGKILVAVYNGENGKLQVGGTAQIDGSSFVPVAGSLYQADQKYSFLEANAGITGTFQSSVFSGMMSAEGAVDGNIAQMKLVRQNNMGELDRRQEKAYTAVGNMYQNLGGNAMQREMDPLYNLGAADAKAAMTQLYGGLQADLAGYIQRRTYQDAAISARVAAAGHPQNASFAGENAAYAGAISFDGEEDQGWWINLNKSWDRVDSDASFGELHAHSFGMALGRDKKISRDWRVGTVFTYESADIGGQMGNGDSDDYRLGIYGNYQRGDWDTSLHLAYGWQKNDVKRYLPILGYAAASDYKGNTLEFGIQARYDTQKEKTEKVVPYAKLNVVKYSQDAYEESGAGIYNQYVDKMDQTYSTAELGMEYEKQTPKGELAFRLGYKRVLNGENPEMKAHFAGDLNRSFGITGNQVDKDYVVVGFRGESRFTDQWTFIGKVESEIGSKNRSTSATAMLQYEW